MSKDAEALRYQGRHRAGALRTYCRRARGIEPPEATLVRIDCDGLDVRADRNLLGIEFDALVRNAGSAREALMALARDT